MDRNYVVLERGDVTAVIVNNEAVEDDVLPNHRAGYSGVASLTHSSRKDNIFVPFYAGLNYEHIHDGTVQERNILFEPRNAPMAIKRIGDHKVELHQKPSPHWKLESRLTYEMLKDGTIEMTLVCTPRERTFKHDYIGLFFASYIHQPESLDIFFRGHGKSGDDIGPRWIRGITSGHGDNSTHPGADDKHEFPHDPEFPLSLVFNKSNYVFDEPWYYAVNHGMALIQMFREKDTVRISQSPSGGGNGNPAWDFQWFIEDYEVGKPYEFVMRAMYVPYESPEQVTKVSEQHRKELNQ